MTTTPNAPATDPSPAVRLIRDRRLRLGLSRAAAARKAGISDTYWRQIEEGQRILTGPRGVRTLARMAHVVGITPGEMADLGAPLLASELASVAYVERQREERSRAEAGRMVDLVTGLSERDRVRLEKLVADDIRQVRGDG